MYELFEHTADVGLRMRASSREELFADAARALVSLLVAEPESVQPRAHRQFRVLGDELEYLLFDWLSELLYSIETDRWLWSRFEIQIDADGLTADCWGEPIDRQRHHLEHEVKAITYHGLFVRQEAGRWQAEVVVDI
jgi:SHS2 domain-containing protein